MNAVLQLKIIGYYGHCNMGDEQYKISFIEMFERYMPKEMIYEIIFYDCDKIHEENFSDDDIIILGGGDILNDYFLDKIYNKFNNRPNKILAISVGLPFVSDLFKNKLNVIDYIFIRSLQDIQLFKKYFDASRIYYLPDISFFLKDIDTEIENSKTVFAINTDVAITADTIGSYIQTLRDNGKKIACVSFTRHIYNKNYESEYNKVLEKLCDFVDYIDKAGYHVIFLPFNDNTHNATEDDTIIHKEMLNKITNKDVTFINSTVSYKNVFSILKHIDIYIMSRFHACLFSIYNNVPLLPIYSTRKIDNLLLDIDWQYSYRMDTNGKGIPIDIDLEKLKSVFIKLQEDTFKISKLNYINKNIFEKNLHQGVPQCIEAIINGNKKLEGSDIIEEVYKDIKNYINSKGVSELEYVKDDNIKKMVVNIVEYKLIGCINSVYNWGLLTKMFVKDYDYNEEWVWIMNHYETNRIKLESNEDGLFNIGFMDQVDYSKTHRSGWQYVYDNIKYLQRDDSDLLLDLYIDRTFHWNREINKVIGIIPYKKNWIGFVHHTFDTTFSEYNCNNLIDCEEFQESLEYCRGIFVLSKYLEDKFRSILGNKVPIYTLIHPTEMNVKKFTIKDFEENEDKKMLHIGGWLRNTYAFYNLCIPTNIKISYGLFKKSKTINLRKVALRGKNNGNYFPEDTFNDKLYNVLNNNMNENVILKNISQNNNYNTEDIHNNWYKHFYKDINSRLQSVEYIDHLENDDYDVLLTKNIVCILLVDASAINTLVECIVRNTPIIINKIAPVVELLGPNYPLYLKSDNSDYNSLNVEIDELLSDKHKIRNAYKYLKRLDKTKYDIQSFVNEFVYILLKMF